MTLRNIYKTNIAGMDLSGAIEYNPTNNSYMRFESRHLDLSDSKGKLGEVFLRWGRVWQYQNRIFA